MPVQIVDIDLSSETGALPEETYSDAVVIGRASVEPAGGFNRPRQYTSTSQVAADFGDDSDVYEASQSLRQMGAEHWYCIVLEETTDTEVVGDSDTSATNTGFTNNAPIAGGTDNVSISVDGTSLTPVPVADSPPEAPTDADTAHINFQSGEIVTGTDSSGAGAGIEITYPSLSWTEAFSQLENSPVDIAALADVRADRSYIGDLDELVTWGSGQRVFTVAALENGNRLTDDDEAVDLAHDIGSYIPSPDFATFSHKSDDDVASYILGQLATEEGWFDLFWDGDGYPFQTDYYRENLIGEPSVPGTFEGGASEGQQGASNVIFSATGTLISSNSLTTAGASSNYRYIDVRRTESMVANEARRALESLRLRTDYIPFDDEGQLLIYDALKSMVNKYTGGRKPLRAPVDEEGEELDMVYVPDWDDLTTDDRANRRWSGIRIEYRLAGNVHTFGVEIHATV